MSMSIYCGHQILGLRLRNDNQRSKDTALMKNMERF